MGPGKSWDGRRNYSQIPDVSQEVLQAIYRFWTEDSSDQGGTVKRHKWHKKPVTRVLIAGNGLSMMAKMGKGQRPLTWEAWISKCWSQDLLGYKASYADVRGLSYPERISFMSTGYLAKESDESAGARAKKARASILGTLRDAFEPTDKGESVKPGAVHRLCIEIFDVIITTNYDTLFERAAKDIADFETTVSDFRPGTGDSSFSIGEYVCNEGRGKKDELLNSTAHSRDRMALRRPKIPTKLASKPRCQRRSKISPPGRSKTSPLNVMRYAVLGGCPGSP